MGEHKKKECCGRCMYGQKWRPGDGKHWKQCILDQLLTAIRMTEAGMDVTALRYDEKTEMVHVDFESGEDGRIINVKMDSGFAMIRDVVNNLDIG